MKYTVQLLYPDYMTPQYGLDFFATDVELNPEPGQEFSPDTGLEAAEKAREIFRNEYNDAPDDPYDMALLAVLAIKDGEIVFVADSTV